MNDRFFIPTYRARSMTPPGAVPMPELPTLRSPARFSWLKSVLFPGIQLAVLGGGIYLLFTFVMKAQSFHMGYMIAFMGLGMVSSLICSTIEYLYSKRKSRIENEKMTVAFFAELDRAIQRSVSEGYAHARRINEAFPAKDRGQLFSDRWSTGWLGERSNDDRITVRIGSLLNAPNPAAILPGRELEGHPLAEEVRARIRASSTIASAPRLLHCDQYRCISLTGPLAEAGANAIVGELLASYTPDRVRVTVCGSERIHPSVLPPHISYGSVEEVLEQLHRMSRGCFLLIWCMSATNSDLDRLYRAVCAASSGACLLIHSEDHAPAFSECDIHISSEQAAELTFPFTQSVTMVPELLNNGVIDRVLVPLLGRYTYATGSHSGGGERIPDRLSLFDHLRILAAGADIASRVRDAWNAPCEQGLSVTIGQGPSGPVELDLTACRGHGIMAGMTGSGKSQFLLSLVALLCTKYSPDYFTFAIIDFKGEASAIQLEGLPHYAGALSDLDGSYQLKRVLIMLEAESRRRQQLLNEAKEADLISVNEIEYYQARYRRGDVPGMEALPYLLIVIDEFVDAKQSDNSFLENIARIARQGRSRGIYLLLSAQNPSSQIGGQIAANIGYDICFKVREESISQAIIGKPDAALIAPEQRGRGYLLTDQSGLVEFQTPYGGGTVDGGSGTDTQMKRLVSAINNVARARGCRKTREVFARPLPEEALLPAPTGRESLRADPRVRIPIGMSDNVYSASIDVAELALDKGNVMVCGAPGMGKTTLLQSMIYVGSWLYPADALQFWICSFGLRERDYRAFANVPNVIHTITLGDTELLDRMLPRLQRELDSRRARPEGHPKLVVVVDGLDTLSEEMPSLAGKLIAFSKNAFSLGICFVFSSVSVNVLPMSYRQSIATWMAFKMDNDPYEHYFPLRDIKAPSAIPGRFLLHERGSYTMEVQSFTLVSSKRRGPVEDMAAKVALAVASKPAPTCPVQIEKIPDTVTFAAVRYCRDLLPVGIDRDYPFSPVGFPIKDSPFFVVSGDDDSVVMHRMVRYLLKQRNFDVRQVIVVDPKITQDPFEGLYDESDHVSVFGAAELDDGIHTAEKYDETEGEGYTFIFLCNVSMLRSMSPAVGKTYIGSTLGSQAAASGPIYRQKKVCYILSDSANALQANSLSTVSVGIMNYRHGLVCGGTTKGRWGVSDIERVIPEGYGYLYGPKGIRLTKLYQDE